MCVLRCIGSPFFVGMLVKFNCMIVNASANLFFTAAFYWLLSCLRILMKIKRYHLTCFVDTFLLKLRYDEVPPQWVKNTYIIFSLQNQPNYYPEGLKYTYFPFPNQDKCPHPPAGWVKINQFFYWQTTMVTKWPLFSNHSAVKREQITFILMYNNAEKIRNTHLV